MSVKKSISAIIPNYNGINLLPLMIPALVDSLNEAEIDYEVIVADDCSIDESVNFLSRNFPNVKVVGNSVNSGFAETVNLGIKSASKDLVFILNSDVILEKDYFIYQLKYFDKPDTFGVNGTIVNSDDDNLQGGGKILYRQGFKIKTNTNFYLDRHGETHQPFYSMFLTGTNALIDRKKINELNGFAPLFSPYYVEDVELSIRAWRLGWKCYYEPKSVCRHELSASIKKSARRRKIYTINVRNKFFLHALHLDGLNLAGWWAQTCLEVIFRIITGNLSYVNAFGQFLLRFDDLLIARKEFKGIMRKKNQEVNVFELFSDLNQDIRLYKAFRVSS